MGRCGKYEAEKAEKQQEEITSQWIQTCWENWVTVKVVGLRVKFVANILWAISQIYEIYDKQLTFFINFNDKKQPISLKIFKITYFCLRNPIMGYP